MHTVPKWVLDNAVYVLLDCVIYCACYSILFRGGGGVFSGHGVFNLWTINSQTETEEILLQESFFYSKEPGYLQAVQTTEDWDSTCGSRGRSRHKTTTDPATNAPGNECSRNH